jgi:hypothetical protein
VGFLLLLPTVFRRLFISRRRHSPIVGRRLSLLSLLQAKMSLSLKKEARFGYCSFSSCSQRCAALVHRFFCCLFLFISRRRHSPIFGRRLSLPSLLQAKMSLSLEKEARYGYYSFSSSSRRCAALVHRFCCGQMRRKALGGFIKRSLDSILSQCLTG